MYHIRRQNAMKIFQKKPRFFDVFFDVFIHHLAPGGKKRPGPPQHLAAGRGRLPAGGKTPIK
nr:hypothetical protein [uncultured Oscillibacter sp.]